MHYQTPQYDVYNYNMCAYNTKMSGMYVEWVSDCLTSNEVLR